MIPIHDDLLTVLDAVEIESPARYLLLGEPHEVPGAGPAGPSPRAEPTGLMSALAGDLYERLYLRPTDLISQPRADVVSQRDLMAALSAANTGRGTWEPGWSVRRVDEDGTVVVVKDGVGFWVSATGLRTADGPIRPGGKWRVSVAKELRHLIPGYYVAIGDEEERADDGEREVEPMIRYYWHLMPGAAVPFVAAVTSLLNASQVPFRVKVLSDPNTYHRADAGVLYARRRYVARIGEILARIHSTIGSGLRPEVPLFTRRLADGLGFAEDPINSLSFGQHRCQLAAQAMWRSFALGEIDRDARVAALASAYLEEGLDPLRPHLGPGSHDDDDLQLSLPAATAVRSFSDGLRSEAAATISSALTSPIPPLEAAARIGHALCRSAYWDRGGRLCNWMGRSVTEVSEFGGPITPAAAACGPDLYAGSAGIALYLAQLHAVTGDTEFKRTALGAIERSIHQLKCSSPTEPVPPLSFFCGHLGVAYAGQRVEDLTGHDEVNSQAGSILDRVVEAASSPHLLDVISGNAGAIPALLSLGGAPGLERCHELAITLGEELCRTALRQGSACAWEPEAASGPGVGPVPLTGLSHGAAGIGLALFELHAATGRPDFLETARGAFAYEDSLFDPRQGNWPDLRRSSQPPRFARTWCHGAPGIALSRLRAGMLDPDRQEDHLAMARVAIATTLEAIEQNLGESRSDATLCHGLSGLGEVVLIASQLLDKTDSQGRAFVLAHALLDRHASSGDWPSGVPSGGPNPSLMLGLAGIGYWLLRLHDPAKVPPFLLLIP
ncbi:MAG: lanthionine synthetase LanC family protein [Isosphaerales bacterium]